MCAPGLLPGRPGASAGLAGGRGPGLGGDDTPAEAAPTRGRGEVPCRALAGGGGVLLAHTRGSGWGLVGFFSP